MKMDGMNGKYCIFMINDNADILSEILSRLDGKSLGVSACVCRKWRSLGRSETVWEAVCNRHVSSEGDVGAGPRTKVVVAALGGYRRLYRTCVGPVLDRLGRPHPPARHLSLSLSLSLFSIDCYERLWLSPGKKVVDDRGSSPPSSSSSSSSSSLLFLATNNGAVDVA